MTILFFYWMIIGTIGVSISMGELEPASAVFRFFCVSILFLYVGLHDCHKYKIRHLIWQVGLLLGLLPVIVVIVWHQQFMAMELLWQLGVMGFTVSIISGMYVGIYLGRVEAAQMQHHVR